MKIVKAPVFVFDDNMQIQEIKNVVIDFEDEEFELYTRRVEMRLPSIMDGKESTEYEDVYTGVTLVGAIGSRVECSVKSAVRQLKQQ